METAIQNIDWSALRQHLPLFALLLFSLPPARFFLIKVVLATNSAAKQKVTRQWYISREEEQAAKSYYFDPDAEHHDSIFDARPHMGAQPCREPVVKSAGRK